MRRIDFPQQQYRNWKVFTSEEENLSSTLSELLYQVVAVKVAASWSVADGVFTLY